MSSSSINIPSMPTLPIIGYYNSDLYESPEMNNDYNFNSYNTLENNLKKSCTNNGATIDNNNGIYDQTKYTNNIPPNTSSLNVPFFLAKTGLLSTTLPSVVNESCANDQSKLVNQIQYLTCQLEESRNQVYNSSEFNLMSIHSIKSIFKRFKNLKIFFIIAFFITIYLLINGFFGSLDLATNIFGIISKRSKPTYQYWIGLLIGIAVPVVVLCVTFKHIVCNSISIMESYNITDNPYGEKDQKRINEINSSSSFDILILVLFIILIYGFVAVLFTINKKMFPSYLYTFIVGIIFFIISIFLYVLYAYIPFFNTTDQKQMLNNKSSLMLFISEQENVSSITSNQYENMQVRKTFIITALFIIILGIFFFLKQGDLPIVNGFLGSSAILALPILWIINFTVGIQYFYIYPILLIFVRFIRYIIMSLLYCVYFNKNTNFSTDLLNQFENFKNYSAPWGLIGVDEFKLMLNILGYENDFSKEILDNENSNLSLNKYVSTGFLGFFIEKIVNKENNISAMFLSVIMIVLTIIISVIILYGIVKI